MQKIKWIVVAVVISICGVLTLTKPAHASVKDYTQMSAKHYSSYQYVNDGGDKYYKIGGRKYQPRFVKVIKNVPTSGQVDVVVKYPALKTNLTKTQQADLHDDLEDWINDNSVSANWVDANLTMADHGKMSTKKLFSVYQGAHMKVIITE